MDFTRRQFIGTSAAGALALPSVGSAAPTRSRRIVLLHDVYAVMRNYSKMHGGDSAPFEPFRKAVFAYADEAESQIDGIWWDIGGNTVGPVYPSGFLSPVEHPQLLAWLDEGIDWVEELVNETRRRKLEVFWNHRISEVDGLPEGGHAKDRKHPLKAAHPDWVVPCSYWWQGMWNLAAEGLREHKVAELRELAVNYDLDGIQIDFSRHMPVLPVGRQWELRGHVTEFMRMVRQMLREVGEEKGRAILLAAKVPRNIDGCRVDGLDVGAWADEKLVDVLTIGSRAMDVDVEGFREAVGDGVQLQPCFDDHHSTDGYRYGPIEYVRGVFANHWQRGADSVVVFNGPVGPGDSATKIGGKAGSEIHGQAFREVGDSWTMVGKDKIYAIERLGGYPWSDGYINRNDDAPLPVELDADKSSIELALHISDPPTTDAELVLRVVFHDAAEGDTFEVKLNQTELKQLVRDPDWKDAQIFSPEEQPVSGGKGDYKINPKQKLLRVDFAVPYAGWKQGANEVKIRLVSGDSKVKLEKVEAHLGYKSI